MVNRRWMDVTRSISKWLTEHQCLCDLSLIKIKDPRGRIFFLYIFFSCLKEGVLVETMSLNQCVAFNSTPCTFLNKQRQIQGVPSFQTSHLPSTYLKAVI